MLGDSENAHSKTCLKRPLKMVLKTDYLFCCFTSQVNSYGHGGMVTSPNP